jgi:hypothetical protein
LDEKNQTIGSIHWETNTKKKSNFIPYTYSLAAAKVGLGEEPITA